jgi:signal peptidase II
MKIGMRSLILALLLVLCIGCDQATKAVAQQHLATAQPIAYWGNLIRLEYAENPGGFLSLGATLPAPVRHTIFNVAVSIILGVVGVVGVRLLHTASLHILLALACVLGGGVGNLLSRLFNEGHVIDFINVGIGPWRTGTFNVADMAIMGGVAALAIFAFLERESPTPER